MMASPAVIFFASPSCFVYIFLWRQNFLLNFVNNGRNLRRQVIYNSLNISII